MNYPLQLIAENAERWNMCEGLKQSTLLRLAILRDIVRQIHAEKSRLLATGKREDAKTLKSFEARFEELRGQGPLEGKLEELASGERSSRKRTRLLPETLYSAIPRDRFERFDRQWESALAAEAIAITWRFWALNAYVSIAGAEHWHKQVSDRLWPRGVILYVENASTSDPALLDLENPLWQGQWIVAVDSDIASPEELRLQLDQIPGGSREPAPPRWRLLFSPKP